MHEDRFQWFLLSRDKENNVQRITPSKLAPIVAQAKDEPWNNSPAILALTNMLLTSLESEAYDIYVEDVGFLITTIFFTDFAPAPDGVSVDFVQTRTNHYQKYCFFKFASFLDLLCPNHIHWRGQAESESIRLARRGLETFRKGDLHRQVAILARWIREPGPSAFSVKQAIQSRKITERRALLLRLEHLTAPEVAKQLDAEGIKPSRGYTSHTDHYQKNPNSFQARLSKERSEARKMSKSNFKLS